MPQVNQSPDQYTQRFLTGLKDQIDAMSRQQGLVVVDNELRVRVQVGLLSNGDYGVLLVDPDSGIMQELLPARRSFNAPDMTVTTTSWTTPSGAPSVTVKLAASGDALITMSSRIWTTNVNDSTFLGVQIDGGSTYKMLQVSDSASIIESSCSLQVYISDLIGGTLTPNASHTFTVQLSGSTAGHTFGATATSIVVQPI